MAFVVCDIIGVRVNNVNMNEAKSLALLYMEEQIYLNKEPKIIFTPNPEFILKAIKDKEFLKILNESDLNIPDGIGVVIASKILGYPLKERVAGYDLIQNLFNTMKIQKQTVYFLGGGEGVSKQAKEKMEKKYRGLKIIGTHSGYFSKQDEDKIIEDINNLRPDLLLVGLGCPKQEKWIYENKNKLETKLIIGVGGSFDVMSQKIKRAPNIFIKLNIEWLYRLITQPYRIKRIIKLPIFLFCVIKYRKKAKKNIMRLRNTR